MNQFGIVVNFRNAMAERRDIESLMPSGGWIRSIVYSLDDIERALPQIPPNVMICVCLNNENDLVRSDWSGWSAALQAIVDRFGSRIQAVECGSELDRFWAQNENDVPPAFGADLVKRANAILGTAGIYTLTASVAGPKWQEWLEQTIALCRDQCNGVAFHPYGQRPDGFKAPGWGFGDLRPSIARAYDIAQKPVWLTEYGVKLSDAGGAEGQAEYARTAAQTIAAMGDQIVPMACYFALSDQVGTSSEQGADAFGLIGASGQYRPAFGAYQTIVAAITPTPEPLPEPAPVQVPVATLPADQAALMDIWQIARADVPFNPDAAICRYWVDHIADMGSPAGPERVADDGTVYQAFTRGRFKWTGAEVIAA